MIGPKTANRKCEKMMEEHVTVEEDPTTLAMTALFNTYHRIFKGKSSTQQTIPLKMDAFRFTKTVYPRTDASGRSGDMLESIQVANICSVVLDEDDLKYKLKEQAILRF